MRPRTIVLGLLKDAEGPLTVKELHAALGGRLEGQGAREKVGESTPEGRAKRLAKVQDQVGEPLHWVDGPVIEYILI